MRSFQIQDKNVFMTKLLTRDVFDRFLLTEASITSYATFEVDGAFHSEYFKDQTDWKEDEKDAGYCQWTRVRPFIYDLTKGKLTPLKMRIVLSLAPTGIRKLINENCVTVPMEQIGGLFVNIQFDGAEILCTSGISTKVFTTDRSLEQVWDEMVEKFFQQNQISFL